MNTTDLGDDFFRHEYGRLVAMLSRRIGVEHVQDIEDAVQSALVAALSSWTAAGVPDNRSAWLYRVASNNLNGELRQRARRRLLLEENAATDVSTEELDSFLLEEVQDDLLRMLFVCCDESIPPESQLVLALKTLCGFDTREIAVRLFTSDANVYKRLTRARTRLQENCSRLNDLSKTQYRERLSRVHQVLYLLFTEGYLSSHAEFAIRQELCSEAIRLATILAEHDVGQGPQTYALLALMHLHHARITSRKHSSDELLLLHEQDPRDPVAQTEHDNSNGKQDTRSDGS